MAMKVIRDLPWIPFAAARFIEGAILRPDSRVFEWGSGGSTVWWAKRSGFFVSVENRANWHAQVTSALREYGVEDKCEYLLRTKGRNGFANYVSAIDPYEPFDIIFVDGRERAACLKRAVRKIKSGGYIVLDNPDMYPPPRALFKDWELYQFYGYGMQPLPGDVVPVNSKWHCWIWRKATEKNCQEW